MCVWGDGVCRRRRAHAPRTVLRHTDPPPYGVRADGVRRGTRRRSRMDAGECACGRSLTKLTLANQSLEECSVNDERCARNNRRAWCGRTTHYHDCMFNRTCTPRAQRFKRRRVADCYNIETNCGVASVVSVLCGHTRTQIDNVLTRFEINASLLCYYERALACHTHMQH